jgi:hypothetical protein
VHFVYPPITDNPIRLILGGVCIRVGIATFLMAELLRRLNRR